MNDNKIEKIDNKITIDYLKEYKHELMGFGLVIVLITVYYFLFEKKNIDYNELFSNMNFYYINLDRSMERRLNLETICQKQNIIPQRIEAIDGKKIDINDKKYHKAIHKIKWWFESKNMDNIGHFGCYLSHMKTYETFLNSDKEYCLIFEDDIQFLTNDLKKEIHKNMDNLPDDWDILLLGYEIDARKKKVKNANKNTKLKNGLLNIKYFVGLHAYIIKRKTAQILLENLQTLDWILDWNISFLAERNIVNVYGVYPPIVCQPAIHMIDVDNIYYQYNCSTNFKSLTNK